MAGVRCIFLGSLVALAGWTAAAQSISSRACVMTVPPDALRYAVTGHVVDNRTGRPIAGASVSLLSQCELPPVDGQPERNTWSEKVTSDNNGEFRFNAVPGLLVSISASLDGYLSSDDPFASYRVSPNINPITLRLAVLPSISGVVRGADGSPMANVQVVVINCYSEAGRPMKRYEGEFRTGADGVYVFRNLRPGRRELIASMPHRFEPPRRDEQGRYMGYVPVRYPKLSPDGPRSYLELPEGEQATVDFEFREQVLHRIAGTTEVSGAIVSVVDSSGTEEYFVRTTGPRAHGFEGWVPTGRFWLKADFASGTGEYIGSLPIEVGDTDMEGIDFPFMPRNILTIPLEISAATPEQIRSVRQLPPVLIYRIEPNGYARPGGSSTMTGWMRDTGPKRTESFAVVPGAYAIALEPGGTAYAQSITRGGKDLLRELLTVTPEAEQEPVRLVLAEGASVEGVLRRGGNPVRGWVYAIPEHPDGRMLQWVSSDANGKFRVDGLAPAAYRLFACEVPVQLDGQTASELPARWQQLGQGLALAGGKTTSVDLEVSEP